MTSVVKKIAFSPFMDVNKKTSSSGHAVGSLDGVRGLAVLIVLASHTSSFGMYAQGSLGVMLFYVLSGFVLSIPFVDNPRRMMTTSTILTFFRHRALRIIPIYWATILLTALIFNPPLEWIIWNASFIKGWNHFWSVAQEVRFYILFPLIIIITGFTPKFFRIPLIAVIGYFAFETKGLHLVDMMDGRHVAFYFFMFLAGVASCFTAHALANNHWIRSAAVQKTLSLLTTLIFLGLFLSSTYWINELWSNIFSIPKSLELNGWARPGSWAIIFGIFLVAVTLNSSAMMTRLLNTYFLRHIGLLSYGIYLLHMIFLDLLLPKGLNPSLLFVSVFGFAYIAALLSYAFIEKPFLTLKKYT